MAASLRKPFDSETGLYYYGARYYNPVIGRFITADLTVQHPGDPQDLNRYTYCRNNPVNLVDPTGLGWWSDFWGKVSGFFGAVIGTIVGIVTANPLLGIATYSAIAASGQRGNFGKNFGINLVSGIVGWGVGLEVGAVWGNGFWSGLAASALGGAGAGAATSAIY
ncbi:MAG: RHS repeat-associated core domain-containing protein [Candidatus Omnitrophica bacterium]|nr:RHS repeat-associated core domain-containing protein [Candidatus Omnitrophota bacterium]